MSKNKDEVALKSLVVEPLVKSNPIAVQMLGICSALAVTVQVQTSLVMAFAVALTTSCSSFFISCMRNWIPSTVRIIIQLMIISTFVILIDQLLRAYAYEFSKKLSVYVGLIITNCIVMGRAEAFAMKSPPVASFVDGFFMGMGYGLILLIVSVIRELVGSGSLLGIEIFKTVHNGGWYVPNGLFLLAPSAFFLIGCIIWAIRTFKPELREE